ncbi:hypothetical protein ACP70R_047475 [Stipagrostis hirtigluma subsp. patula]
MDARAPARMAGGDAFLSAASASARAPGRRRGPPPARMRGCVARRVLPRAPAASRHQRRGSDTLEPGGREHRAILFVAAIELRAETLQARRPPVMPRRAQPTSCVLGSAFAGKALEGGGGGRSAGRRPRH